jgi:hypothetical protein
LAQIRDAEVEQAIGRLRAVNRERPVEVILVSDAVLRQPVQLEPIWDQEIAKPGPLERMILTGGVAFLSPSHAAKAYPKLWSNRQAASYHLPTADRAKYLIRTINQEFCPVVYEVRRPRSDSFETVLVDPRWHTDHRAAIEQLIGPVAEIRISEEYKEVAPDPKASLAAPPAAATHPRRVPSPAMTKAVEPPALEIANNSPRPTVVRRVWSDELARSTATRSGAAVRDTLVVPAITQADPERHLVILHAAERITVDLTSPRSVYAVHEAGVHLVWASAVAETFRAWENLDADDPDAWA